MGTLSSFVIGHGIASGPCSLDLEGCFPNGLLHLAGWLVIMIVWSSSIEHLSARLYNYSIIADMSKDSDWKKGIDGPNLLLKF